MEQFPLDRPHRVVPVPDRGAGRRVDVFLQLRFPDWSRSHLARFIRSGHVVSDLRTLKPSSTLQAGEVLRVYIPGIAPIDAAPPLPPVLHEDDALLALDKPAGLIMHPVGQKWAWGLVGIAKRSRPDDAVDLSHRLDRDTSGVCLLTKNPDANRYIKQCFMDRRVSKLYWALVRGVPPWDETVCDAPLGSAVRSAVMLRQGANPDGAHASTRFEVLQRLDGHALVACKPVTGRTHQIRAHLEHLGFPILGDKLYGQPDDVFLEILDHGVTGRVRAAIGFPRHALHARAIAFPHPKTGQILRITAPLPADMAGVVDGAKPAWPADVSAETHAED